MAAEAVVRFDFSFLDIRGDVTSPSSNFLRKTHDGVRRDVVYGEESDAIKHGQKEEQGEEEGATQQ
jgi:hypothetical protein